MKKLILILAVLLTFSITGNTKTFDFKSDIEAALAKLEAAKTVDDYEKCRLEFNKISQENLSEWIPIYYEALCSMMKTRVDLRSVDNEAYILPAEKPLDKLKKMKSADKSEVCTLIGLYYMDLIRIDRAKYGMEHYEKVLDNFEDAIKTNKENPRPLFFLTMFEKNLPPIMQSGRDYCESMKKAKTLYTKQVKAFDKPYWGESMLDRNMKDCK